MPLNIIQIFVRRIIYQKDNYKKGKENEKMNEIKEYTDKIFEDIKYIDENGNEYWLARELMPLLEYTEWRKFKGVINKAITNCKSSNYNVLDHFVDADKMVYIGSNTKRKIQDYKLSRYACYLIVLNCDPRKKIIAFQDGSIMLQIMNIQQILFIIKQEKLLEKLSKKQVVLCQKI